MSKVRAYNPVLQFFNDDGSPMVGGHLNTYKAGTSTPVTTYADASGTRNPASIPLDSRGECVVYLESGKLYKFVLVDKDGVVKWTADNYCINEGGGSGGGGGGGGSSVPLVRVVFQNGAWSKISGDDGFIKNNPYGTPSLYLPEDGWWLFNVTLSLRNPTPRDLIQQIQLEWDWWSYYNADIPPITYGAQLPAMQENYDFTRQFTRQNSRSMLYKKDSHTDDWLVVAVQAYQDTLPNDLEAIVGIDIFKVRDA